MRQRLLTLLELVEILAVVAIAVGVIAFIAQPFRVQGDSMKPNFFSGDYVLVDKLSYQFRPLERGEVVVFRNPENESEYFIKRVVGLPGEEMIISGGRVTIDGQLLNENYLPLTTEVVGEYDFILGLNEYFVMGDNRPKSRDSRVWGALERDKVIGLVRLRFWPPNEFGVFAY